MGLADLGFALFRETLRLERYPHQVTTFVLCALADYPPERIVQKLSGFPLRKLLRQLERFCVARSQFSEEQVREAFSPLRERIALPVHNPTGEKSLRDDFRG